MRQLRWEDRVIDGPREGEYLPGLQPTSVPSGSSAPAGCSWNLPTLRAARKVGDGQPRGCSQIKQEMLENKEEIFSLHTLIYAYAILEM